MADSPFKGLLYSPEVLGGIGLLTAGLSGKAPDMALPMMMQGMKTASMFKAMEDEEEKRKLIKEYEKEVPEDQQKIFKMFPLEWLKKHKFGSKKTELKEIWDPTLNDGKGGYRYEKSSVIADDTSAYESKKEKPTTRTTTSTTEIFKDGDTKAYDVRDDNQYAEMMNLVNEEGWSLKAPPDKKGTSVKEIFKDGETKVFDVANANEYAEMSNLVNEEGWSLKSPDKLDKPSFTTFYKKDGSQKITLDLNNKKDVEEAKILLAGEFSIDKPEKYVKPDIITLKSADGKTLESLNISDPEVATKLEDLLKDGYTEFKQNVTATDVSGLNTSTKSKLEKQIVGGEQLLGQLKANQAMFKDEFLTYAGKIRYEKLKLMDKAGLKINQDDRAYLNAYSVWDQGTLQYFNQYRKEITGVAAGEKEIGWLEASIPSRKDTPTTYRAKMKNQIRIQKQLLDQAKKFRDTGGKVYEINDKGEKVYSEAFGKHLATKIKPNGEYLEELFKSYKIDYNYKANTAIELMNLQFPNQDWEDILEKYLNAKAGKGL